MLERSRRIVHYSLRNSSRLQEDRMGSRTALLPCNSLILVRKNDFLAIGETTFRTVRSVPCLYYVLVCTVLCILKSKEDAILTFSVQQPHYAGYLWASSAIAHEKNGYLLAQCHTSRCRPTSFHPHNSLVLLITNDVPG